MSAIFKIIDTDDDGLISYQEFKIYIMNVFESKYGLNNKHNVGNVTATFKEIAMITVDEAFKNIPNGELMDETEFKNWYNQSLNRRNNKPNGI